MADFREKDNENLTYIKKTRECLDKLTHWHTQTSVRRPGSLGPLTLRRLMSYIHMEHPFLMFLDHTQRRSTVGRTPLDE